MFWGILSSLVALAPFAVWGLRAYLASIQLAAAEAERKAGRDAQQNEATNAEINRVENAANAGAAVDGVRGEQTLDPNDRDRK